MTQSRITVLTFVEYYLPGFKAGGPSRTIANLVARLGDEIDFKIVTRDRDLGDASAYLGITPGSWSRCGNADVLYLPPSEFNLSRIGRLLRTTSYDILYLNSLFNPRTTLLPLLSRHIGIAPKKPCIIAPRGELGAGALELKRRKKKMFLALSRRIGLYRGLTWQASSTAEAADIRAAFRKDLAPIRIAPNVPGVLGPAGGPPIREPSKPLKVIFVGRVSPMKNLLFALDVLCRVRVPIDLTLCGPKEDLEYWRRCQELIRLLPQHVRIKDVGPLRPDNVSQLLCEHELFFLPTLGENFGHAIAEAMQCGLPVLTSDRTPWRDLVRKGLGADISLDDRDSFVAELERRQRGSRAEQAEERARIMAFARNLTEASEALNANCSLFAEVFSHGGPN